MIDGNSSHGPFAVRNEYVNHSIQSRPASVGLMKVRRKLIALWIHVWSKHNSKKPYTVLILKVTVVCFFTVKKKRICLVFQKFRLQQLLVSKIATQVMSIPLRFILERPFWNKNDLRPEECFSSVSVLIRVHINTPENVCMSHDHSRTVRVPLQTGSRHSVVGRFLTILRTRCDEDEKLDLSRCLQHFARTTHSRVGTYENQSGSNGGECVIVSKSLCCWLSRLQRSPGLFKLKALQQRYQT